MERATAEAQAAFSSVKAQDRAESALRAESEATAAEAELAALQVAREVHEPGGHGGGRV